MLWLCLCYLCRGCDVVCYCCLWCLCYWFGVDFKMQLWGICFVEIGQQFIDIIKVFVLYLIEDKMVWCVQGQCVIVQFCL